MKNRQKELVEQLTDKELVFHLYLTQIFLLTISLILGMILFDELSSFVSIIQLTDSRIYTVGGTAGLAVVILDLLMMKILPARFYDDGGLNNRIFRNKGLLHIALIAAIVATVEEILFRGIIQTNFGLIVSSIIFAIVHFRYLFNWFLFLNITTLSFFIGYLYLVTGNLLVTIFMHFIIDFLLGIFICIHEKKKEKE